MSEPGAGARPAAPWRDGLAVAVASLALYLLLAQEALHGLDVHVHVFLLTQGVHEHPYHVLYLRIAAAAWSVLADLGFTPHHALRLLSAAGTALGVLFAHRAAAGLGLDRVRCALAAALAAVPPAVVFFATVPEIHGVFAAFASAAWWAWSRVVVRPGPLAAVVLGVATGVAASVHATGHLLLGSCALALFALLPHRQAIAAGATAAAAHVTLAAVVALALQPGRAPFAGQFAFLRDSALDVQGLANLWRVIRDEWLLAFLPLSVLSIAALWRGEQRRFAAATVLGLLVYLVISHLLLDDIEERGAYLLPLALPFALLTIAAVGVRGAALAGIVALAFAWVQVRVHDRLEPAAWLPGFLALAEEAPPAVICRDVGEQVPITRALPDVPFVRVDSLLDRAQGGDAGYREFCTAFDAMVAHYRTIGRTVLITRGAYETLLATEQDFFVRFLREHLPAHYRLEQVARGGFAAWRVQPR